MNEVKRYIENIIPGHPPCIVETPDGYLCLFTDYESERALRIEAETKLYELQDAIGSFGIGILINQVDQKHPTVHVIKNHLEESRKRREGK